MNALDCRANSAPPGHAVPRIEESSTAVRLYETNPRGFPRHGFLGRLNMVLFFLVASPWPAAILPRRAVLTWVCLAKERATCRSLADRNGEGKLGA